MTGEIGIHGDVKPVGGIYSKVTAARYAGADVAIIPFDNIQSSLKEIEGIRNHSSQAD